MLGELTLEKLRAIQASATKKEKPKKGWLKLREGESVDVELPVHSVKKSAGQPNSKMPFIHGSIFGKNDEDK